MGLGRGDPGAYAARLSSTVAMRRAAGDRIAERRGWGDLPVAERRWMVAEVLGPRERGKCKILSLFPVVVRRG